MFKLNLFYVGSLQSQRETERERERVGTRDKAIYIFAVRESERGRVGDIAKLHLNSFFARFFQLQLSRLIEMTGVLFTTIWYCFFFHVCFTACILFLLPLFDVFYACLLFMAGTHDVCVIWRAPQPSPRPWWNLKKKTEINLKFYIHFWKWMRQT